MGATTSKGFNLKPYTGAHGGFQVAELQSKVDSAIASREAEAPERADHRMEGSSSRTLGDQKTLQLSFVFFSRLDC